MKDKLEWDNAAEQNKARLYLSGISTAMSSFLRVCAFISNN